MKEKLRFPGVPVYMNGRNYFIPSLSVRQYRDNQEVLEMDLSATDGESAAAYMARLGSAILPVILLAVQRNYPDITIDNLEDWLGGPVLLDAWKATQGASGMEPVTEGEELPAATGTTGTGSSAESVQP